MKQCVHCNTTKAPEEFPSNARLRGGLDSWCRKCHSAAVVQSVRKRRLLNPGPTAEERTAKRAAERMIRLTGQACDVPWRECLTCQTSFIAGGRRKLALYCTPHCQSAADWARVKADPIRLERTRANLRGRYGASQEGKTCDECGGAFIGTPGRRFCTPQHANRYHRKVYRDRKRATCRGASKAARVHRADVFERDGWICGLCHELVERRRRFPDPQSASLDHIIPVSRGGEHTPENVQLAHLICNSRKSARLVAA